MFCTKCGAENPDGNSFCGKCGSPLTQPSSEQQTQQAQPMQPIQPDYNAGQPVYQQQPYQQPPQYQQSYAQQPPYQQPYGQPAYGAPYYQQGVPKKKSKAVPIVIVTVVVLALAFAAVWFFVLRSESSIDDRLLHVWERRNDGQLIEIFDFKDNYYTEKNNPREPMSWSVEGNDKLIIRVDSVSSGDITFYYSISGDGQTLTLYFDEAKTDGLAYQRTD